MARLPDVQTLGAPVVPETRAPIATIARPGLAEAVQGEEAMRGVGETAKALMDAGERIMAREEGFNRLNDIDTFENEAKKRALELIQTGDLSDPTVAQKFAQDLRGLEGQVISNHKGRDESKLQLTARLQELRNNAALNIAAKGTEAAIKKVDATIGQKINEASMDIYLNPSSWGEANDRITAAISEIPMSADRRESYVNEAIAQTTSAAVTSMVMAADFTDNPRAQADVADILSDTRTAKALGETRRVQLLNLMLQRRAGDKDTELVKDAKFAFPDDLESQRAFVRAVKLKPANQISIDTKGELAAAAAAGRIDAEKLDKLRTIAEAAITKKTYLAQFETALNTGGFVTGSLDSFRKSAATLAELIGAPDDIKNLIGSASTAETMDSAAKRLALFETDRLRGRGLKLEAQLIQGALPGLMKTPEGNKILVEIFKREANRDIEVAQMATNIFRENMSLTTGKTDYLTELAALEERNPIIDDVMRERIQTNVAKAPKTLVEAAQQGAAMLPENLAGTIPQGWEYEGFNPTTGVITLRNKANPQRRMRGPAKDLLTPEQ